MINFYPKTNRAIFLKAFQSLQAPDKQYDGYLPLKKLLYSCYYIF